MWQRPMNVSKFKVYIYIYMVFQFFFYAITTSTDLSAFIPLLRSQILFQGSRAVPIIVYIMILPTLAGLPPFFIRTFQRVLKLQLSL